MELNVLHSETEKYHLVWRNVLIFLIYVLR